MQRAELAWRRELAAQTVADVRTEADRHAPRRPRWFVGRSAATRRLAKVATVVTVGGPKEANLDGKCLDYRWWFRGCVGGGRCRADLPRGRAVRLRRCGSRWSPPADDMVIRPRLYERDPQRMRVPLDRVLGPIGVRRVAATVTGIDIERPDGRRRRPRRHADRPGLRPARPRRGQPGRAPGDRRGPSTSSTSTRCPPRRHCTPTSAPPGRAVRAGAVHRGRRRRRVHRVGGRDGAGRPPSRGGGRPAGAGGAGRAGRRGGAGARRGPAPADPRGARGDRAWRCGSGCRSTRSTARGASLSDGTVRPRPHRRVDGGDAGQLAHRAGSRLSGTRSGGCGSTSSWRSSGCQGCTPRGTPPRPWPSPGTW